MQSKGGRSSSRWLLSSGLMKCRLMSWGDCAGRLASTGELSRFAVAGVNRGEAFVEVMERTIPCLCNPYKCRVRPRKALSDRPISGTSTRVHGGLEHAAEPSKSAIREFAHNLMNRDEIFEQPAHQ